MSEKRNAGKKPDNSKSTRGRPPKPLPRKTDGTPYTPHEVARIITTTNPKQLENRD